jgi:phage minor structural protein
LFINVDYNRRPQKAKLHLAKPNKQVISIITEKFADSVSLKLGNINELNFSIPHFIEGERNKHVDLIKEKMLIKLTLGAYQEWYVVETIEENGDDSDVFVVNAFSLGYELKRKRVTQLSEESVNARDLLNKLLEKSVWSIGEIDPIFEAMFRTLEINDSNILDSIIQAGETYGALIVWDTLNRKVSFKDMKQNGRFRGMTVNYGKFLRSIKRTRTTDEMVTRLHIEGSEGITIHGVNPTGMGYIEDFSYFMYPFERDANGNVIKSSHFMSDELCVAIVEHKSKVEMYTPEINSIIEAKLAKEAELFEVQVLLDTAELELENILVLLDTAQATGDEPLIAQRKQERDDKAYEILVLETQVDDFQGEIDALQGQIDLRQVDISYDANFTPQLLDELDLFIIEKSWKDDRYTDVQELYNDGLKRFEELRQPKVVIDVTIDNLLNIIEEQYYWDKLVLGDLIKVKYPQMNIEYMAKIIEIKYNLEAGEASLVIANTTDLLDETEKLVQLLYSSSSATSLIQNNKYKWDKINSVEKEVNAIITQEWDANKNKIVAGVNNTIEVGNRGIIIRNPDFPNEVVIMQSGIIALSKDGGETWKTAVKPDGIVAERLIGQIIAGQELIITNSGGSFTFDKNGVYIRAESFVLESGSGEGSVNLRDVWNGTTDFINAVIDDNIITAYEKKMLKQEWDRLKNQYDSSIIKLNGYYDDQGASILEVVSYHQAYEYLYEYLFEELQTDEFPLLDADNMTKSTRVDRVIFERRYNDFYERRTKLDEILALRAKELAQQAQQTADEAKENIKEVENDIVYKIELYSSKGFTFKNGQIDTTVIATVYRGKDDITATIPASGFIWKKYDKDGILDQAWTTSHVGVGNTISITPSEVYQRAIFRCDVDIVEE